LAAAILAARSWPICNPCRIYPGLPSSAAYDNNYENGASTNDEWAPWMCFKLDGVYDDITQVMLYGRNDGLAHNWIKGYTVSLTVKPFEWNIGTSCGSNLNLPNSVLLLTVACPAATGTQYVSVSKPNARGAILLAEIHVVRSENCVCGYFMHSSLIGWGLAWVPVLGLLSQRCSCMFATTPVARKPEPCQCPCTRAEPAYALHRNLAKPTAARRQAR
jgi:hypothetical protein